MSKKITFEESMQRLESIVHELERGDVTLEQSIKLFEEGAKLSAVLSKQLDEAEQKVTLLVKNEEGVLQEQPFLIEEEK